MNTILSTLMRGVFWIITIITKGLEALVHVELDYNGFTKFLFYTFLASTALLFWYLNGIQPEYYIDEAFHVPQTLRYCAWNFTEVNITENFVLILSLECTSCIFSLT